MMHMHQYENPFTISLQLFPDDHQDTNGYSKSQHVRGPKQTNSTVLPNTGYTQESN